MVILTFRVYGSQNKARCCFTTGYYYEGFLSIQRAVDLSIISELSGLPAAASGPINSVDIRLKSFPYPQYLDDDFIIVLQMQLPFIIMISFIITAPTFCKDVVLEKEKKLKVRTRADFS